MIFIDENHISNVNYYRDATLRIVVSFLYSSLASTIDAIIYLEIIITIDVFHLNLKIQPLNYSN
jgi:hypothetical protein